MRLNGNDLPHGFSLKDIVIYNDSPEWGGHEVMSVELANAMSRNYQTHFIFFHETFDRKLDSSVNKIRVQVRTTRPYFGFYSLYLPDVWVIARILRKIRPSLVIVSQGVIEHCLKGLWAAKLSGIKTVSYIPLGYSYSFMGAGLGELRDFFCRGYLRFFDSIITISEEQKRLISEVQGYPGPVYVLENMIPTEGTHEERDHETGRTAGPIRIAVIGRINFRQKAQDRTLDLADRLKNKGIDFQFVVIGDGKDREKLETLVRQRRLSRQYVFKGWVEDPWRFSREVDLVLILSRFEGVPLILLESLIRGIMVLAPDDKIFNQYLDREFLFDRIDSLAEMIGDYYSYRRMFLKRIGAMSVRVIANHNGQRFCENLEFILQSIVSR